MSTTTFPRVYLDADAIGSPALIRALGGAVSEPGALGATARRDLDLGGCSWPVRAFYRVNAELPAFEGRLFGRGVIALAEEARKRFDQFPDIIADDMLLDAVVAAEEKREVPFAVRVEAPRDTGDLVRRLARGREGNEEFAAWMRVEGESLGLALDVSEPQRTSWLRDVVARKPRLAPDAAVYVALIARAEQLRRSRSYSARSGWGTRSELTARSGLAPSDGCQRAPIRSQLTPHDPGELGVGDEVAAEQAAGLEDEPVEPLEPGALHPLRRPGRDVEVHAERRPDEQDTAVARSSGSQALQQRRGQTLPLREPEPRNTSRGRRPRTGRPVVGDRGRRAPRSSAS